jgi:Protein of unknown function (DUF3293)
MMLVPRRGYVNLLALHWRPLALSSISVSAIKESVPRSCHQRSLRNMQGSDTSSITPNWQEIWAESYDCWVDAPGSSQPIFACPQRNTDDKGTNEWPDQVRALTLPIFAFTAFNPRGQERSIEENIAANRLLEKDLIQLSFGGDGTRDSTIKTWWNGFGFNEAASWRESGFVVCAEHDVVLELARKYEQGGIYQFIFTDDPCVVRRCTLPVLLPNVEADVNLVTTTPPPGPLSKVDPIAVS